MSPLMRLIVPDQFVALQHKFSRVSRRKVTENHFIDLS
ncbi:hypothetical protein M595_5934 [Lyngbya aestuarii BL J]|uniref:Uncharacterized protein n=1 Tax=Lyngbya aestuarii BL J TaxID=1348334 RepID=U7QAQ9_9CYAN|nr:hypothetical protein M595_5934 [Lyngbya aestuarii BL J]